MSTPESSFPSQSGWHRVLAPRSSGANTSTSMGVRWPWPLPPRGPSFVCQAGVLTPPPLPQPLAAHSNSCLGLSTPFPPSHQPRWALGTRATDTEHVWLPWWVQAHATSDFPFPQGSPLMLLPVHTPLFLLLPCHGFSPSPRDASCICGTSPIINKTYIYMVRSV